MQGKNNDFSCIHINLTLLQVDENGNKAVLSISNDVEDAGDA